MRLKSLDKNPITHLLFADCTLIFTRAKVKEAEIVMESLDVRFGSWSGKKFNVGKSHVHFSKKVCNQEEGFIVEDFHLQEVQDQTKYLGLRLAKIMIVIS